MKTRILLASAIALAFAAGTVALPSLADAPTVPWERRAWRRRSRRRGFPRRRRYGGGYRMGGAYHGGGYHGGGGAYYGGGGVYYGGVCGPMQVVLGLCGPYGY